MTTFRHKSTDANSTQMKKLKCQNLYQQVAFNILTRHTVIGWNMKREGHTIVIDDTCVCLRR